jgi:hypothetical protein
MIRNTNKTYEQQLGTPNRAQESTTTNIKSPRKHNHKHQQNPRKHDNKHQQNPGKQ